MLIRCLVIVQDTDATAAAEEPALDSCLRTKILLNRYVLSLKNAKFPEGLDYQVGDLLTVSDVDTDQLKISLVFRLPKHSLTVLIDSAKEAKSFTRHIRRILSKTVHRRARTLVQRDQELSASSPDEMTSLKLINKSFDQRILLMRYLSHLVMENCVLPNLPLEIGHLPIKYLSLSHSKLGGSLLDTHTLWDWMSEDTIIGTLTYLKMNSIGLMKVPFEIMFLKNLESLLMANNKLKYLPHFLCEMKNLHSLSISQNQLCYFPEKFFFKSYNKLEILNNPLLRISDNPFDDHIFAYIMRLSGHYNKRESNRSVVKSLSHLSFVSLLNNCTKFKKQDIPSSLWTNFDVIGRCFMCGKLLLPEYSVLHFISYSLPSAHTLLVTPGSNIAGCQSLQCRFKCLESLTES